MAEQVEAIVVGAGLAGLAAAYKLADAGIETIVVERGDYPGSKNVTGGRLYLDPIRRYFPSDFFADAPFERRVVKERLSVMADDASTTVEYCKPRRGAGPGTSYTVLRGQFDRWLADKASERGALIITKNQVEGLRRDDAGRVVGVRTTDSELDANVVILADGVLSLTAVQAGLRGPLDPKHHAVGVKQVVELSPKAIQHRFGIGEGEGVAHFFFGCISQGMLGGGFMYTNRSSVSLGVVVGIQALKRREPPIAVPELLEILQARPEVSALIEGGVPVEYSAHVIPEGGIRAVPRLVADRVLVAGDAAGLALNMGITVRGMDFALASGALAARAVVECKAANDYTATALGRYRQYLHDSFVLQDLTTFGRMLDVLDNNRLFNQYPQTIADIMERLFLIDDKPKARISSTVIRQALRSCGNLTAARDALGLLRV